MAGGMGHAGSLSLKSIQTKSQTICLDGDT